MPTVTVSRATAANAEAEGEVEGEGEVIIKNSQNRLHPLKMEYLFAPQLCLKAVGHFYFSFIRYSLFTCIYSIVKRM